MSKVVVFGGSFDPIHNGHLYVASRAQEIFKADEVQFLIAKTPRWKNPECTTEDRLKMLKIALKDHPSFKINDFELSTEGINYTYNTIKAIKKQNDEMYFIIGADQVNKLDKWYEIDKLSKLVHIVGFTRPGNQINEDNVLKYHVTMIRDAHYDISSTELRDMNSLDAPKGVLDYIKDHELYYIKKIHNRLSEHRFKHTISVADTAYEIASQNKLNAPKAYLAGLLHDIAKEVDEENARKIIREKFPDEFQNLNKALLHQFVGVKVAEEEFNISDKEILRAIKYHATGHKPMSPLGMIIYSADKIEPTRGYDSSEMIKACCNNYYLGFKLVLKENIKFLKEKGLDYDNPLTHDCVKYYLEEREDGRN